MNASYITVKILIMPLGTIIQYLTMKVLLGTTVQYLTMKMPLATIAQYLTAKITHRLLSACLFAVALCSFCGCGSSAIKGNASYRTVTIDPMRDTKAAIKANSRGLDYLAKDDLAKAAEFFTKALEADVEYGPAHNNLGKVYFRREQWYEAAWEFDHARRLLPRHGEPCNNLALVLEESGRLDEAVDYYRQAIGLDSKNIGYKANLARALIRRGDHSGQVRNLLTQILEKDTRPDWLIWAKQRLAAMTGQ